MSTVVLPKAKTFCSVNEAADVLGCTVGRVRQLIINGTILATKLNERAWAVDVVSLREYGAREITVGRRRIANQA